MVRPHLSITGFWVGFPAYFSSHSSFSMEHNCLGFNEFSFIVYWWIVMAHPRPQGLSLFRIVRWDFTQCNVSLTRDLLFWVPFETNSDVQLIPYPSKGIATERAPELEIEPLSKCKHWTTSPTHYTSGTAPDDGYAQIPPLPNVILWARKNRIYK